MTEAASGEQISRESELAIPEQLNDRIILQAIQRFFTEKNCFRKAKPGKSVSMYFSVTNDLLRKELNQPSPNPENTFTILANMLLLLNNASANSLKTLTLLCYDAQTAISQLEKACHIDKKYARSQSVKQHQQARKKAASTQMRKRVRAIQKVCIAVLLAVLLLGFVAGFFFPHSALPVEESTSIFEKAVDWVRYDILGNKKIEAPVSPWDRLRPYTYLSGFLFVGISIASLLIWVGLTVTRFWTQRYHKRITEEWVQYQRLRDALKEAEATIQKMGG